MTSSLSLVLMTTTAMVTVVLAAPITRLANDTLRLPASLPSGTFETEDAFPTLSFSRPVAIVSPPGGRERLFIVEQGGRIQVISDLSAPSIETFLDLTDTTRTEGESGLLGLAFHPHYAANRQFYAYYTIREDGQRFQRVARFLTDPANPNRALRESETPLIDQRDQASNHNGGDLRFGPDGYLYISFGDEGGANDQYDNSRFIDKDFFSAIARIDVDQRPGSLRPNAHEGVHPGSYTIPPDNPFIGQEEFLGRAVNAMALRTEFWAVGLRNPWRMHFDGPTGRLFCADVGQNAREEVNLITRGNHYGWSFREGTRSFTSGPRGSNVPNGFAPTEPIWDYPRSDGISVTGGVVYRGEAHTELYEAYIFGDYGSGQIWAMHFNDDDSVRVAEIASDSQISAFGHDPRNGDVLLASYSQGTIKRIARKSRGFTLLIPSKLSLTGAFADLETLTPNPGIVPYSPNVSFWSDGAEKQRWFAVPDMTATITFHPNAPWTFPVGTTWIKHFELELTPGDPSSLTRLETRFLVKTTTGSYGLTYAWNDEQTDATLVGTEGMERDYTIMSADGPRTQRWTFPSRNACRSCHTKEAGHALGFYTAQLNRSHTYADGTANQLAALTEAGYFENTPPAGPLPQLADPEDTSRSLADRARAYLATNCSQCHRPNGPALGLWDGRVQTPLSDSGLVNGPLVQDGGDTNKRVIAPGMAEQSMILLRMLGTAGVARMPPLGSNRVDTAGVQLIREWVLSLDSSTLAGYERWLDTFIQDHPALLTAREADPDLDGLTNEQEYVANTHPARANERWTVAFSPDGVLDIPPTPNGMLDVETSADARFWTSLELTEPTATSGADGSYRVTLPQLEARRFYRFRLWAQD